MEAENGIIVGRFQVDSLHVAHEKLISTVVNSHPNVYIFLGVSPLKCTVTNPLPFDARKAMLLEKFPAVNVLYIADKKDDYAWSKALDAQIADLIGPNQKALLYGGRDSFLDAYTGRYPTKELMMETFVSGSAIRKEISAAVVSSPDFRKGVIWATANQYVNAVPTVDAAIFSKDYSKILLARKDGETDYRFIGGFVNPGEDYFRACGREVKEETGLSVSDLKFVTSEVIQDWRYASEKHKITTILFVTNHAEGKPEAMDDIVELKWVDFQEVYTDDERGPEDSIRVMPVHTSLFRALRRYHKQITGAYPKAGSGPLQCKLH